MSSLPFECLDGQSTKQMDVIQKCQTFAKDLIFKIKSAPSISWMSRRNEEKISKLRHSTKDT